MRVVLVEDDYLQAESIHSWLRQAWPHVEIDRIETEKAFRAQLQSLSTHPPDVIIMDVMLRWSDPSPDFDQPPDEVEREGFYRAGVRCAELLRDDAGTSRIPVILYSVLEKLDLAGELAQTSQVRFLPKSFEPAHLVRLVGSLVAAQKPTKQPLGMARDVFICHATEDKVEIVAPLVAALRDSNITVWHDRAEIRWGDSMISKVEEGLRISRYVLAVLSKHSVTKSWPRRELNAALNSEALTGDTKLLPLIVGTAEERTAILRECALLDERLYEVWTGSTEPIVQRVKQRLN